MRGEFSRIVDWRAPPSVRIVDETRLFESGRIVMASGIPFTGTSLAFDRDRVIGTRSFERGIETDSRPFALFANAELLKPAHRIGPCFTSSIGSPLHPQMISEGWTMPRVDGVKYSGLIVFDNSGEYRILASFVQSELSEFFWMEDEYVTEYVGNEPDPSACPKFSLYRWDTKGRLTEHHHFDRELQRNCEITLLEQSELRSLRLSGDLAPNDGAPRHEFDRFGSLVDIAQLEGCRLSDYVSLGGSGIDADVGDFLLTLLPAGQPKTVDIRLDVNMPPASTARFLATLAGKEVGLTNTRPPDPALLESVMIELARLRPDLTVEVR